MQVWKLEQKIFEIEAIRVFVRASSESKVKSFAYERKAAGNTSLTDWLKTRVTPLVGDHEVVVVNGRGEVHPHGGTHMSTLRDSYSVE